MSLFFVLSGFLITTLLLQEHREHGAVSLTGFYRRRALRLLPALFAFLGASVLLYGFLSIWRGAFESHAFKMIGYGFTYSTNIAVSDAGNFRPDGVPLGHLWSLAMEEQFYFVWPFVLVVALRMRRRLALLSVLVATALVTLHTAQLARSGESFQRIWYAPDSAAAPILVGCALGLGFAWRGRATSLGLLALPAFVALAAVDMGNFVKPGASLLVSVVCAALVVSAVCDQRLAVLLSVRPLVYLGTISYGLYLWQELAMTVLGVNVGHWGPMSIPAIVLSLVLAVGSYYLIELPFLRRKASSARANLSTPQSGSQPLAFEKVAVSRTPSP